MKINDLIARIVKIIGTRHPRLRPMIRNHPYTKIVGVGIAKCLLDEMGMESENISDEMLENMVEKGIALYHEKESAIEELDVLEQKRKLLCEDLKQTAEELIAVG